MMRLAGLKPSHQLKQAVPGEAKCLLYQQKVDAVDYFLEVLTELYEPLKDSTLMQEILKISQQQNERLRVLSGQMEDDAQKYSKTLELPFTDLDKLIENRTKHAFADQEMRNQLLWDQTKMTLDEMVQEAQQFEYFNNNESVSLRSH